MISQLAVEVILLFISSVKATDDEWWLSNIFLCTQFDYFKGQGNDGNEQLYSCSEDKPYHKTTMLTDDSSCTSNSKCFLDEYVVGPDVCMSSTCVWFLDTCYCEKVEEPLVDCPICAGPTYNSECSSCTTEMGFGIFDANHECQCDVEFFEGSNCNGGSGSGALNLGLVPFVEDSCEWDPLVGKWRSVSCHSLEILSIQWYEDRCITLSERYKFLNDTCYQPTGAISNSPTTVPSLSPIWTERPTAASEPPTYAPVVVSNEYCNQTIIQNTIMPMILESGDTQWYDDCELLLETQTQEINILCGCIGKLPQASANNYLNCELIDSYNGLDVHSKCKNTIYAGSDGSSATSRRLPHTAIERRRTIADSVFKLVWAADTCTGKLSDPTMEPTNFPSMVPTFLPTLPPTLPPDCIDLQGNTATSEDCMCGEALCTQNQFCISANNDCYETNVCSETDGSMLLISTCVCGVSGVTCDFLSLGSFLCNEHNDVKCYGVPNCTETNGDVQGTDWCLCQHSTSSWSTCQTGQYCDSMNGWCSSYPTCIDTTGATKTAIQCLCSSLLDICEIGEYCISEDEQIGCSPYTPSPTPSPTSAAPTAAPTNKTCTDYVYTSEETVLSTCPPGTWGSTDRGWNTMIACDATFQSRLLESMLNGLMEKCSSWCIYDLVDRAVSAYKWDDPCWLRVTDYLCYRGKDSLIEEMANISSSICPQSEEPTPQPTPVPSTAKPTSTPSQRPTDFPSLIPSRKPTIKPTVIPTNVPTDSPTVNPTGNPTFSPSHYPTPTPTHRPSAYPTFSPSHYPTHNPTYSPSVSPTTSPTNRPTSAPTFSPTVFPTPNPSSNPTDFPSRKPTFLPSKIPTRQPTHLPTTLSPTFSPTTLYTYLVDLSAIHNLVLEQLPKLALSIGNVLELREPAKEVNILETSVLSYTRRRLIRSSTQFEILFEDYISARVAQGTLLTNLFEDAVMTHFNDTYSSMIEFSVDTISEPRIINSEPKSSEKMTMIIVAALVGVIVSLLLWIFIWRCRVKRKRKFVQKQVLEMFRSTPGISHWEQESELPPPPSDSEINRLFERDYMDMEGQIEGLMERGLYTTNDGGYGVTEGGTYAGGTYAINEGENNLQVLTLRELIGGTAGGDMSSSESGSSSSKDSQDDSCSSPTNVNSPQDFGDLIDILKDVPPEKKKFLVNKLNQQYL